MQTSKQDHAPTLSHCKPRRGLTSVLPVAGAILACAILFSAAPAFAQALPLPGPSGPSASSLPPSQQKALMMAQMQFMKAQQKALEDPLLIAEREKIRVVIEKEMLKNNPKLKSVLKRFHELEKKAKKMQAQQAPGQQPDMVEAQKLMKEMSEIGPKLEEAQRAVMKNPAVKKQTDAFEKKLDAKMRQIDPTVPAAKALIERSNPNR